MALLESTQNLLIK